MVSQYETELFNLELWVALPTLFIFICLFLILVSISLQPTSSAKLFFSVPCVPWIPGISVLINIYLMTMLDVMTWIRFAVWIALGLVIYFCYGLWNSNEKDLSPASSTTNLTKLVQNGTAATTSYQGTNGTT